MTEPYSPYAQVPASTLQAAPEGKAAFYVVGTRKLTILLLITFGLYSVYWFYRQWSEFKASQPADSDAGQCWPVARGLFAVFFVHALFREVRASAPDDEAVAAWNNDATATPLVLTMIASGIMSRMSNKDIGSPFTDVISLLLLIPEALLLVQAQQRINAACGDPEGASNAGMTGANYAWIVVGGLCWLLALVGIFMPQQS